MFYIEVLQRVKTPTAKPKNISESGSEDRWVCLLYFFLFVNAWKILFS